MRLGCLPNPLRRWLGVAAAAGILVLATGGTPAQAQWAVPTLDPTTIPKFVDPVPIPGVLRPFSRANGMHDNGTGEVGPSPTADGSKGPTITEPQNAPGHSPGWNYGSSSALYFVSMRQFQQQMLPTRGYQGKSGRPFPKTTVWGYGRTGDPLPSQWRYSSFFAPGPTIEARVNDKVEVVFSNELVDHPLSPNSHYLPHLFPIDQTLHWANPPGPPDTMGTATTTYTGPVPLVPHLHGGHTSEISDGYPEAWFLPNASDIPAGYSTRGSRYSSEKPVGQGKTWYEYRNDQRPTTLWYHDHALGMTRTNVYAGLAAFYLLRDDYEDSLNLPGPAPRAGDRPGTRYYEIPLAIQDKSFDADGSMFFPDSRAYFDGYTGPYIPDTDVPPIWNPEFFGETIIVNGRTWPYLNVEPRKYRFRILNGCNARFFILKFSNGMDVAQIGNDGGLLPDAPQIRNELLVAPAERVDIIVDFSTLSPGQTVNMINLGPDEPFGGGVPNVDFVAANPATTGQVMQFRVIPLKAPDTSQIPVQLPPIEHLSTALPERMLTLNEVANAVLDIPVQALLGTAEDGPLHWGAPITETPVVNTTEIWSIANLTEDGHPIHLHLIQFEILDRTPFDAATYGADQEAWITGGKIGPAPSPWDYVTGPATGPVEGEQGTKDTVIAYPGQITRIIAHYDLVGRYVWHCHILDHEDNEMMRPYEVVAAP